MLPILIIGLLFCNFRKNPQASWMIVVISILAGFMLDQRLLKPYHHAEMMDVISVYYGLTVGAMIVLAIYYRKYMEKSEWHAKVAKVSKLLNNIDSDESIQMILDLGILHKSEVNATKVNKLVKAATLLKEKDPIEVVKEFIQKK